MLSEVDYLGRMQATAKHFTAGDRTVVAQLPVKGTKTLYSRLGDFFLWTCLGLPGLLTAEALLRGLRKESRVALHVELTAEKSIYSYDFGIEKAVSHSKCDYAVKASKIRFPPHTALGASVTLM